MKKITYNIFIAGERVHSIIDCVVTHSDKALQSIAKIKIPTIVRGKLVDFKFTRGNTVLIEFGYDGDTHTVFTGFVREVLRDKVATIVCEDNLFLLREPCPDFNHYDVSIGQAVNIALSMAFDDAQANLAPITRTIVKKQPSGEDPNISIRTFFRLSNIIGSIGAAVVARSLYGDEGSVSLVKELIPDDDILASSLNDKLAKENKLVIDELLYKCILKSVVVKKTTVLGFIDSLMRQAGVATRWFPGGVKLCYPYLDSSPPEDVSLTIGKNVEQSDLTYRKVHEPVQVRVKNVDKKGVWKMHTFGDVGGEVIEITRHGLNSESAEALMSTIYNDAKTEKYEGSMTLWLRPNISVGGKVIISDVRDKDRGGEYYISATETSVGPSGGKQKITISNGYETKKFKESLNQLSTR